MRKHEPSPFPSADDIARRAHELFASEGRRITMIPEYWRTAERQLLQSAANRVLHGHRRGGTAPDRRRSKT